MKELGACALRDEFMAWQCRLRQISIRREGGRPTSGMRPEVLDESGQVTIGEIIVLIVKRDSTEVTAQLRHIVQSTQDPAVRYDSAVRFLSAAYYQQPKGFADELTGLFGPPRYTSVVDRLLATGRCRLEFSQYRQQFRLPCTVRLLEERDAGYEATYWHNRLFNPELPPGIRVLGFQPDWDEALALSTAAG